MISINFVEKDIEDYLDLVIIMNYEEELLMVVMYHSINSLLLILENLILKMIMVNL